MKYIKGTLAVFVVSLVFSAFSVGALNSISLIDVEIPIFKGLYISSQKTKTVDGQQYITKVNAIDRVSGDGRNIESRTYRTTGNNNTTEWLTLPKGKRVTWKTSNSSVNFYKLHLRSVKSLPTTAGFWGTWEL